MGKKICLSILLMLLLQGCNGYKDIDKRFFVVALGIDLTKEEEREKGKYEVILKLAVPQGDPKQTPDKNYILVSEKADIISDAVRILQSRVDKELDFGHTKVIVFGEELVENENIADMDDWFLRKRQIQLISWVTAGSPTARAILDIQPEAERIPANALLLAFGDAGTESAYISHNYLYNLFRASEEKGLGAYLPVVGIREKILQINNTYIFDEGKSVLKFEKEEAKWFNVLLREVDNLAIEVKKADFHFMVTVGVIKRTFKINTPSNASPSVDVNIEVKGEIEESTQVLQHSKIEKYEKMVKEEIEKQAKGILEKLQEVNADPYGLGLQYRRTHYGEEKAKIEAWESMYPDVEFKVNAEVKLRGTGIVE